MITLYSTECPKCKVLTMKLNQKGVQYNINTNIDEMLAKGIKSAPVLEIDGELYDFMRANNWVNNLKM